MIEPGLVALGDWPSRLSALARRKGAQFHLSYHCTDRNYMNRRCTDHGVFHKEKERESAPNRGLRRVMYRILLD